jgi:hypothetical protein
MNEGAGRLPSFALFAAFAASLALHALALFSARIDLSSSLAPPPLTAELRPAPPALRPSPPPEPRAEIQKPKKAPAVERRPPIGKPAAPSVSPVSVPVPEPVPDAGASVAMEEAPDLAAHDTAASPEEARAASAAPSEGLPPRGRIRFRVDIGDSGFEIGFAYQEWAFEAGRYRLRSSVGTTGLARLLRSVAIDMESIGRISGDGLQPEAFGIMRSGRKARERALFDWESMKVRVGSDNDYALDPGTQDLLSFYYQLAFLDIPPGQSDALPIATGKKYDVYRLENLGDETLDIPLGTLRARHLRSPGESVTEIWLAYDYHLLPVRIRHVDNDGKVFVQVATQIRFEQ